MKIIDNRKIEWLGRRYRVILEHYLDWQINLMEEDGGAWAQYPSWRTKYKGKTFLDAVNVVWKDRNMDEYVNQVLHYRKENYGDASDEELGIEK